MVRFHHPGQAGAAAIHRRAGGDRHRDHAMGHAGGLLRQVDAARRADSRMRRSDVEWFCPMHPTVVRDNRRDKCPICFMPLSKRKKGSGTKKRSAGRHRQPRAALAVSRGAGRRSDLDVRLSAAEQEIHAVGYVEFNERGQTTRSPRASPDGSTSCSSTRPARWSTPGTSWPRSTARTWS